MEPITTTVLVSTVVGYLAKKLKDNETFQDFTKDFTSATINWIRPLFLQDDGTPKEVLEDLKADPSDKLNTDAAENTLGKALKKDEKAQAHLQEIYDLIKAKEAGGTSVNIVNSKNVVTGNVNTGGGNFTVGDGNVSL